MRNQSDREPHAAASADWAAEVRARLANADLPGSVEADLVEEWTQHLADRERALRAAGCCDEEAIRQTRAQLTGDPQLESRLQALRRTRLCAPGLPVGIGLDLKHAVRSLAHDWRTTGLAVLTLALGIGASSALLSAVDTIVRHPVALRDPDRLAQVWLLRPQRANWHFHVPPADFAVVQANSRAFEALSLYDSDAMTLAGRGDAASVGVGLVDATLFPLLGVQPRLGRAFDRADEEPGHGRVAIVSDRLWRQRWAADAAALGSTAVLNGATYRVVGVMPAGFDFPEHADVWLPRDRGDSQANGYILGRLRTGVTVAQAQADMDAAVAQITRGRPAPGMSLAVEPLERVVTRHSSGSWLLLLAAVLCVFAISCVNVSNLILARGLRRREELDLRLALGASRGKIVRLLAIESAIVAAAAAVLATLVAVWALAAIRGWAPADTPRLADLGTDRVTLGLALAGSTLLAFGVGLAPAVRFSRQGLVRSLRSTGASTGRTYRSRSTSALLVLEIALATVLVAGAVMLVRSLMRLTAVDTGFRTERALTATMRLASSEYREPSRQIAFVDSALARLRALPGVRSASASTGTMLTGLGLVDAQRTLAQRLTRDGAPSGAIEEAQLRRVDDAYFDTTGMRVVQGRGVTASDAAQSAPIAVVNQAMARAFWGNDDVVGRRVAFERRNNAPAWLQIVGVVNDTRDLSLTEPPRPELFIPLAQSVQGLNGESVTFLLRTSSDPLDLADAVRAAIRTIDPAQAAAEISTLDLAVDRFVVAPRFRTGLLAGLALLGLVVAFTGIHAVATYAVTERLPEIGIRLALGATPRDVARLVLTDGLKLAAAGAALGMAGSLAVARVLRALLFEIAPVDVATLALIPVAAFALVAASCYVPARRAAAVDPVSAVRGNDRHPGTI